MAGAAAAFAAFESGHELSTRAAPPAVPTGWTALLAAVVAAHALLAPFTKVEESFNLQATHDLLCHGPTAVNKFDHQECPGVVPRTFLGALAVAAAAAPVALPLHAVGLSKLSGLLAVRLTLVSAGRVCGGWQ